MQFLLKAKKKDSKFSKISHWVPLLLRVFLLLSLIFLLARPLFEQGANWLSFSEYKPSTLVCIIDRSTSMRRMSANSSLSLQETARKQILSTLMRQRGKKIILFDTLGTEPFMINESMAQNPALLDEVLQPTDTAANLPQSIKRVMEWLTRESVQKASILVYSDMQKSSWDLPSNSSTLQNITEYLEKKDTQWELKIFPIKLSTFLNRSISIEKITYNEDFIRPQLLIESSSESPEGLTLEIQTDQNTRIMDLNLSGSSNLFSPQIALSKNSKPKWVRLAIPTDSCEADNDAFLTTTLKDPKKILFCIEDKKIEKILLAAAQVEPNLILSTISPKAINDKSLSQEKFLILQGTNKGINSSYFLAFLKNGGTIISFPGKQSINSNNSVRNWLAMETRKKGNFFQVNQWNKEIGILANTSKGQPLPFSFFQARKRAIPTVGKALAFYDDGKPFVTKKKTGQGVHYYFSTLPVTPWSNLEDGFLLVPIIQRIYQSSVAQNQTFFGVCGNAQYSELPAANAVTGEQDDSPFTNAGIYQVDKGFSAYNRPQRENDMEFVTKGEIMDFLSLAEFGWRGQTSTMDIGKDEEIWKALLLVAVGLLLAESFFSLPPKLNSIR